MVALLDSSEKYRERCWGAEFERPVGEVGLKTSWPPQALYA